MRPIASMTIACAAAFGLALGAAGSAGAQGKGDQGPPPLAAPKPYKPVSATAAAPMNDASFDAVRKQIGEIATKKNKSALAALVVAKGFFWDRVDGKKADPKKSGADNLSAALGLQEDEGWESLAAYAADPTGAPNAAHKGAVCSPAGPTYDAKAFDQLAKSTGTEPFEWAYVSQAGTEVRQKADAKSPVIEKVDAILVRVYEDPSAGGGDQGGDFTRVVAPSGKVGFISSDALKALMGDQLCYAKDGNAWKIAGYIGGGGE